MTDFLAHLYLKTKYHTLLPSPSHDAVPDPLHFSRFAKHQIDIVRGAADDVACRDALKLLRDALADEASASHVADDNHNDFSRVDVAALDDALFKARAVQRKSPALDAAILRAIAVREKRAELKRRFTPIET